MLWPQVVILGCIVESHCPLLHVKSRHYRLPTYKTRREFQHWVQACGSSRLNPAFVGHFQRTVFFQSLSAQLLFGWLQLLPVESWYLFWLFRHKINTSFISLDFCWDHPRSFSLSAKDDNILSGKSMSNYWEFTPSVSINGNALAPWVDLSDSRQTSTQSLVHEADNVLAIL